MAIRRHLGLTISLLALVPGCAGSGSGSFLSPSTSVGSLKTNLSHMEYENRQLKSRLARLEGDSRDSENRLLQEQTANEELTSRLNDARTLLSQKEGSSGVDDELNPRKTLPAGRSNRTKRKPPFAQIPGRIDSIPNELDESKSRKGASTNDDFGPQSRLNAPSFWLPVATGATEPSAPLR